MSSPAQSPAAAKPEAAATIRLEIGVPRRGAAQPAGPARAPRSSWVLLSVLVASPVAAAQAPTVIDQNRYSPMGETAAGTPLTVPSIDASGITYHPPSGHLFIADSEIEEVAAVWNEVNANVFEVSLDGETLFASYDLGNAEPTGITYNGFDDHFYVTNDDTARLYRYSFDGSGFLEVDSASTLPDSPDPEGVTSDPATGTIYVLDGKLRRVLVFEYQGQLTHTATFDLASCPGSKDVEGIVFDPPSSHLFVVSWVDLAIHEYDLSGSCVDEIDVSVLSPRPVAPQGLARAPATTGGSSHALYIADGGIDNDQDPSERDAAVYEGSLVPAPPGEAFHFNGIRDYLQVPHAPDLYPGTLTISAWIRPARLAPGEYIVSTKDQGGYSLGIDIQAGVANPGVLSSRCRVGGTYYNVAGATPLSIDEWAHVALSYDGTAFRLYVNGTEDGSLSVPGALDASLGDLFIGAESDGTAPAPFTYFAGRIDEVALWNVALTADEIAHGCTPDDSDLPASANLVALWRFEDLAAGVTPDDAGEHDALISGAGHVTPGPGSASVAFRNAAPNPSSLTVSDPILGSTLKIKVRPSTTGHSFAQVVGYSSPADVTLRGGQVVLVGGAKLFQLPLKSGPVANWSLPIPTDCALVGFRVHTQAVHLLGVKPFALSNAQDLLFGY